MQERNSTLIRGQLQPRICARHDTQEPIHCKIQLHAQQMGAVINRKKQNGIIDHLELEGAEKHSLLSIQ